MLRLRTLGCFDLQEPNGDAPGGAAAQPKRVALLTFLAVDSRPDGLHRRDSLVALLWPELDQAHARGALRKTLHHLRGLAPGLVVTPNDEDVRLHPDLLWCDACEFRRLVRSRSREEALALYTGEFLPGVHVPEAAEFADWIADQRRQLAMLATECAVELATERRAAGQLVEAARWAARGVEIAPLEERPNRLLIELLEEAGDRPAALAAYQRFAQRLARDLEVSAGEETRRVADRIRQGLLADGDPSAREKTEARPGTRRILRVLSVGLLSVSAMALGALALLSPRREYHAQRVLVFPLSSPAGNDSLARFGREVVATLIGAISREGVGDPVADPRSQDSLPGEPPSADRMERLARESGAGMVLRGTCSPRRSRTECRIELIRMPGSVPRMAVAVVGDISDSGFPGQLVERTAVMLLLQQRWGDRTTWRGEYLPRSLAAVREFNQGWELFSRRDTTTARHFEKAFLLDTAWMLAALYRSDTLPPQQRDSFLAGLASRPGLSESDREMVGTFQAFWRADWPRASELAGRRFAAQPGIWQDAILYAYYAGRPRAALEYFLRADSVTNTWVWVVRTAAYALHHLGRHEEELKLALRMRERFPENSIDYRTVEIMALAAVGDLEGVRRVVGEAEATPEIGEDWAGTRTYIAGLELMAHGFEEAGRRVLASAVPFHQRLRKGYVVPPGPVRDIEGVILLYLDRLEEADSMARERLQRVTTEADSAAIVQLLGQIAGRKGNQDLAMRYSAQLARLFPANAHGRIAFARATIAAELGDREGAVRLLEVARTAGHSGVIHMELHRNPSFASLRGYPPFDHLLKPRG